MTKMTLDEKLEKIINDLIIWNEEPKTLLLQDKGMSSFISKVKNAFADEYAIMPKNVFAKTSYMTGQEWYERFEKEYDDSIRNTDIAAIEAAKRAARIKDE